MYHVMGEILKEYKPVQAFLLYGMVPYEGITVLRQLLRVMRIYCGDFDVPYTLDWLDRIHDTTPDEDVPSRGMSNAEKRLLGLPVSSAGT